MAGSRPSWDEYFSSLASFVASRSTCLSRKVGAVAVKDKRVLATGYNGAVSGSPHCGDVGCLREGAPSGTALHQCRAVHAEANAVAQAARFGVSLDGATAYVTCQPCSSCFKLLMQAGVERIVWAEGYSDGLALTLARECGWTVERNEMRAEAMQSKRLTQSLRSLCFAIGGTHVAGWVEEAERAAREGKVVKYE